MAVSKNTPSMKVFDRAVKLSQRDRASASSEAKDFDYLRNEVARRLADRLLDTTHTFPVVLDLGSHSGHLEKWLAQKPGIKKVIRLDSSSKTLFRDDARTVYEANGIEYESIVADEETFELPPASVDCVISSLSAHWVNDLPGMFSRIRRVLKPDGAFLCAMYGGETLRELRSAFAVADQERIGGVSPHVSPFVRMNDAGSLLQSAGFNLPAVDFDMIVCKYPDMFTLCEHLQGMGESNCSLSRAPAVSRDVFLAAASAYQHLYSDEEGLIDASFQVIYLIGWSPHPTQQKPKERGTATARLTELQDEKPASS